MGLDLEPVGLPGHFVIGCYLEDRPFFFDAFEHGAFRTAEEIIALCKSRLGSVMAPKTVDFIDMLPRSPVGKVLKKDLRQQYWKKADRKI